jgi:hypothetical protein
VHTRCPSNPQPDQTRVSFTVTPFQGQKDGSVSVSYTINGGDKQQVPEGGLLNQAGKKQNTFTADDVSLDLHFFVPSPDAEGSIHLFVATTFNDLPEGERVPVAEAETRLVICKSAQATTTTTTTTPVLTPTTVVSSSNGEAGGGALGATTTTGGGSLPFTGANAMPTLIAALALVLGGGGLLLASRIRGRRAE